MNAEKIRILLVEDNPGDVRLVREALAKGQTVPCELVPVDRLSKAFNCLDQERFDAVLLDLSLPDGQGLETLTRLQEHAPAMPVVVVTGLDDEFVGLSAVRSGAQDYLVKGNISGSLLARSLRYAIERKQAQEQIQRHLARIQTLHDIGLAATSTLDLASILEALQEKLSAFFPCAGTTTLWLLNRETGQLEPPQCHKFRGEGWTHDDGRSGLRLAGLVLSNRAPVVVRDVQAASDLEDREFLRERGWVSYLGVPLIVKTEVLGILSFYTHAEYRFSGEELYFVGTLAGQIAIALHNSILYEETLASKAELEKALQIKSDFLGTMSHELRTPLHVIMSNAALMSDRLCGGINEDQELRLKAIERNAEDLLILVQGILDITRLEQGQIPMRLENIAVTELLVEVQSDLKDLALKKGVALELRKNGFVPAMNCDRFKLKEVLHNLVGNAVKFTKEGVVEIKARYLKDEDKIEFLVRDTGIGMREEEIPNIFNVFYQVDNSNHREFGGTGLGLNIVKRLVELLQGEVRVESTLGEGSTFYITLPRDIQYRDE